MTRIAISLAFVLAACTDSSQTTMGGGAQPGKPLPESVHTQPTSYDGEGTVAVTLPELPELTLVYEGEQVHVLAEDGSELCTIDGAPDTKLDAAAVTYACGLLAR